MSEQGPRPKPGPAGPLWLVLFTFPLSLGIAGAALAFLYHALVMDNPPGTTVVNPAFSAVMLVAAAVGFWAACREVYRRLTGWTAPEAPPAPPPPVALSPVPSNRPHRFAWLLWLLTAEFKLALAGGFLFWFAAHLWYKDSREASRWQPTTGVVLEAGIIPRGLRSISRPPFVPRVRYRYNVGGTAFEAEQVTTGDPLVFDSEAEADRFLADHRPGSAVEVFYLTEDPRQATLVVSRDHSWIIPLAFGVPCLLMVALFVWRGWGRPPEPSIDIPLPI